MKPWLLWQAVLLKALALWMIFGTDYIFLGCLMFFAGGGIVVALFFQPRWSGLCEVYSRMETREKVVWLTIDDGPCPEDTPRILDLLDRYGAKATFFMIGQRAAAHSELVRAVVARGHGVGNHTLTHPKADFWLAGLARTRMEVAGCSQVLRDAGASVEWYRSPVGIRNVWLRRVLQESDLRCVAWTIRSGDALGKSSDAVVARVLRELQPGSIILMHEGPDVAKSVRLRAIEQVLAGLQERGYRCVLPDAALKSG